MEIIVAIRVATINSDDKIISQLFRMKESLSFVAELIAADREKKTKSLISKKEKKELLDEYYNIIVNRNSSRIARLLKGFLFYGITRFGHKFKLPFQTAVIAFFSPIAFYCLYLKMHNCESLSSLLLLLLLLLSLLLLFVIVLSPSSDVARPFVRMLALWLQASFVLGIKEVDLEGIYGKRVARSLSLILESYSINDSEYQD